MHRDRRSATCTALSVVVALHCKMCPHKAPLTRAMPVIRRGADVSSDVLHQRARCAV